MIFSGLRALHAAVLSIYTKENTYNPVFLRRPKPCAIHATQNAEYAAEGHEQQGQWRHVLSLPMVASVLPLFRLRHAPPEPPLLLRGRCLPYLWSCGADASSCALFSAACLTPSGRNPHKTVSTSLEALEYRVETLTAFSG